MRVMSEHTPGPQTQIRDEDRSTQGGPPFWLAGVIVGMLFLIGAAVLVVVMLFSSADDEVTPADTTAPGTPTVEPNL